MLSSPRFVSLALAVFVSAAFSAFAQDIIYADAHGNRIHLTQKSLGRFAAPAAPTKVLSGGNLTWNITYQDVATNNNRGFDDPTLGATRQATAEAVMQYINSVLNEGAGAALDINFNASETDGTGYLAAAGTLWFSGPNGFNNGFAFEHITTGTDPAPGTVDIDCTVDFGWSWNSDHTVAPTGGQVDLYSVLLHEMSHGLGLLSLSDQNGLGLNLTNPDVYTVWDRVLQFGAGTFCWNSSTTALQVATTAFVSDNLFFSGSNATTAFGSRPPIYAPNPYELGSSVSHFKTGTVDSVMEHSINFGVEKREYTPVDIGALRDIGYTNAATPQQTTITVNLHGWIEEGEQVVFTAAADGALSFQWFHEGQPISGATSATYTIGSVLVADGGSYYCEITTSNGVFLTDTVELLVAPVGGLPAGGWAAVALSVVVLTGLAMRMLARGRRALQTPLP